VGVTSQVGVRKEESRRGEERRGKEGGMAFLLRTAAPGVVFDLPM